MRRPLRTFALIALAAAAGFAVSELLFHSAAGRRAILRTSGRESATPAEENLRRAAGAEQVPTAAIQHEVDLLRAQFGDEKSFINALRSSDLSLPDLEQRVAEHLRERQWIEKQIAPELAVTEAECRAFYEADLQRFSQPRRYRASHLFVAASQGTAVEVLQDKRTFAQALVMRILGGETFPAMVAEASEDEWTKSRGGDLGYFSSFRMPLEFFAEIEKLQAGQLSAPLQSHLGFHIVQLTEVKLPCQMPFGEVKAEIARIAANERRARAVVKLTQRLADPSFTGGAG